MRSTRWMAGLVLVLAACGGGDSGPNPPPNPPPPPPPPPPPAPVATVTLSRTAAALVPEETVQLTATLKDASGNTLTGRAITWSSSATATATVANGLVTAVAVGGATITATSEGKSADAAITVKEGAVVTLTGGTVTAGSGAVSVTVPPGASGTVGISITPNLNPPANPRLIPGTAFDFGPDGATFNLPVTIRVRYEDASIGTSTPANYRLHRYQANTWTPLAGSTVDIGAKEVTGETSSFSLYAILEVAPVATVGVAASTSQVQTGATLQLTATPRDAEANALTGRTVTWHSGNEARATVSPSGLVTGVAAGSVTIFATSEGIEGSLALEVVSPTHVPLFAAPFVGDFRVGNLLDHDIPKEFVDDNDIFTTYWGEVLPGRGGMVDGHSGYDFGMPTGTPLLAPAPGKVVRATVGSDPFFCPPLGKDVSDATDVMIEYTLPTGAVIWLWYAHMSRIDVALNQQVTTGQQIGLSGNTGCSTSPHLHLEALRRVGNKLITFDMYGWEGSGPDPWAQHVDGTASIQLWLPGQAPSLLKETVNNYTATTPTAAQVISRVAFMGIRDDQNPNNEFVEIALDTRVASSASLDGYRLLGDKAGLDFAFPAGIVLSADQPTVRVYSGTGANGPGIIYLGRSTPVWSNLFDDCTRLVSPGGGQYRWNLGNGCPLPGVAGATAVFSPRPMLDRHDNIRGRR